MENNSLKIVADNLLLFAFGSALWVAIFFKVAIIKTSIPGTADIFSLFLKSRKISNKTRKIYNGLVFALFLLSPICLLFTAYLMQKYLH